jgi:dihydroorotase
VTTEVCAHHIDLTEDEIEKRDFDTNCKMHPPLRTEEDRLAVIEGLKDGTIDALCTDHAPHAVEEKDVEFIYAPNGIIGLETAWPVSVKRLYQSKEMDLKGILAKLIDNPRNILHIDIPKVEVGQDANLTFFNVDEKWKFEEKHIHSKSKNTPYIGTEMVGRSLGIYNKGKLVLNDI